MWFAQLKKNLCCSRCPENHPACLIFHHRDPQNKLTEVSVMVRKGCSLDNIIKEIEKCDVLCANCHAKEHFNNKVRGVAEDVD